MQKVSVVIDGCTEAGYLVYESDKGENTGMGMVMLWDVTNQCIDSMVTVQRVRDNLYQEIDYEALGELGNAVDLLARQLVYQLLFTAYTEEELANEL